MIKPYIINICFKEPSLNVYKPINTLFCQNVNKNSKFNVIIVKLGKNLIGREVATIVKRKEWFHLSNCPLTKAESTQQTTVRQKPMSLGLTSQPLNLTTPRRSKASRPRLIVSSQWWGSIPSSHDEGKSPKTARLIAGFYIFNGLGPEAVYAFYLYVPLLERLSSTKSTLHSVVGSGS